MTPLLPRSIQTRYAALALKPFCPRDLSAKLLMLSALWGTAFSAVGHAAVSGHQGTTDTLPIAERQTETLTENALSQFNRFDSLEQEQPLMLAQFSESTLIFFEGDTYSVRILERPDGIFMNVFNRATGVQRPNGQPARVVSTGSSGVLAYASEAEFSDGQAATYIARIRGDNSAELEVVGITGTTLVRDGGTVTVSNVRPGVYPAPPETALLAFEGREFETRVVETPNGTFMNVFDRSTEMTILSRQRAFTEAPRSENDEWRSYVSYGNYRGVPATYAARVSPQGQAQLEIFNRNNGELLDSEDGNLTAGPINNSRNNNYVVAVPGDINTLSQVRAFYPEAYLDRSSQGDFVNAGAFANRDAANARTNALQARGINARILYRQVNFR